ncbi:tryptophan--tRNA ligase [Candidatus Dojkabacteria bacterium]|uniref:Tryptophan--tRNA ligase n=1 Tax=Candidatus Dojkabacteria bacterium TaxID=2099670 RepID=A0A3M0YZ50_9BACT|nr:MAG: tryptophan--tRNA ligase [Candidatus Dojkabacteria bacterium]
MKRVLTGDRPTGKLHLGHFVGSLKNRVKLQNEYDTFILVADVQALTDNFDQTGKIKDNLLNVIIDNLSVGIDPKKVTFYVQSLVPETAELTIYLMNFISFNKVLRNPTVKDEIAQKRDKFKGNPPFGFVAYPINQAADILTPRADIVPVGFDQAPMIENTNTIIKKINSLYGQIFNEVTPVFGDIGRLIGTDGSAKMSKSLGNTIYLSDTEEEVRSKVMKMYTDPNRVKSTDPGRVEGNPVFVYHDAFNSDTEEVKDLKERYVKGTVSDVEVKTKLVAAINKFLDPIRERRAYYERNIDEVYDILSAGTKRAREEGKKTLEILKEAMKINYNLFTN